ncbi:hypothetical protein Javan249_0003 [Streptococcus phage Javan249]|uniref:hypothetical protein n=1 Tax=Streptococcus halotolerans TaxID=1814128 RepID=UPI0007887071|nr:hypothetical protein [Streptococcus halotolerans]QBX16369.1 hypothetical protein Javan249_0003 [Streptococcus phage Javan249]
MKKNPLKIILIILAVALLLAIIAILMPAVFIGGLVATWYFSTKKPNTQKRNISAIVAAIGLFGSIFLTPAVLKDNKNTSTMTSSSSVISSSSSSVSKTTETSTSRSSDSKTTIESSETKTENSTEPTTKNDGPEYTKESNAAFASAFLNNLNQTLANNGLPTGLNVEYYDDNLIYIYVPQDFKYESTSTVQKIADSLFQAKENYFKEWAIDNGYDLSYASSPALYVKAEDGTTLASEGGILDRKMKVKIKNN